MDSLLTLSVIDNMSAAPRRFLATQRSRGIGRPTTDQRRTKSVPRTESGRLLPEGVARKVSEALEPYTEGDVATALETSKDTAQSWTLGRRAPNSAALLAMGRAFDEVGLLIAEEADLGRFYNRDSLLKKKLEKLALLETDEGRFARQLLRELD